MAAAAAEYVQDLDHPITALYASPLQRTRESSEPFTATFGLDAIIDERVIEPTNVFEGKQMRRAVMNPANWRYLRDPSIPSWGEPYLEIVQRMDAAMRDAWERTDSGDVVVVSHQLPIWVTHLAVAGEPLRHDPRHRRCALSSVTSFELRDGRWHEVAYAEPASTAGAVDVGAV